MVRNRARLKGEWEREEGRSKARAMFLNCPDSFEREGRMLSNKPLDVILQQACSLYRQSIIPFRCKNVLLWPLSNVLVLTVVIGTRATAAK